MELTEDTQFRDYILGKMLAEQNYKKRESVEPHLSELIYCLTKSAWKRKEKPQEPSQTSTAFHSTKELVMFAIGVGMEKVLFRPSGDNEGGVYDGVAYEKDLVITEAGPYLGDLGEFKTTRMGIKRFTEEMPLGYYRQFLGYMKAHGTLRAKFVVLFVIGAELVAWEAKVTQEELDKNWAWIVERRDVYLGYINQGLIPPPFTYNEEWECDGCPLKLVCDIEQARLLAEIAEKGGANGS